MNATSIMAATGWRGPYGRAARALREQGWMPIPVKGKHPPIPNYTGRHGFPSDDDIDSWSNSFKTAKWNVAARLTDNLIGIDVDAHDGKSGESTMAACVERLGPLPDTWRSTSRGGGASGIRLYRVPSGTALSGAEKRVREIGEHVDVIHMRHRYVMVAPSKHPDTGRLYRWHGPDGAVRMDPPNVDELPELPRPWLEYLTSAKSSPAPAASADTASNVAVAGAVVLQQPARVDNWLARIPVGSRHATIVSRAGWLRNKDVPLQVAESAALGWLALCDQSASGPVTAETVLGWVYDVYTRYPVGHAPDDSPREMFTPYTGDWLEEQQFDPLEYHVPGIVPEGFSLLVGAPKVGKSWLAYLIALSVAGGHPVLGQNVVKRPVLLLALEDGHRRLQDHARMLLPGKRIPSALRFHTQVHPEKVVASLDAWLLDHGHERPLIIVDTLGRMVPPALPGESAYGRDYRITAELKALCDKYPGTALLTPHHMRKATADDFVDSVSGTNGIAGGADTVLVLRRRRTEKKGLLQVSGRDVIESEYALSFDDCIWRLDGDTLDDAAKKAEAARATESLGGRSAEILAVVNSHSEAISVQHVADAVGIDRDTASTYLGRLESTKRIQRFERGVYGPAGGAARAGHGHASA